MSQVDKATKKKLDPMKTYDFVGEFKNGLATARKDGKMFHINRKGVPAYPLKYDWVGYFQEGFAPAKKNDGYFHIDEDGIPILYNQRFDHVSSFMNGTALVLLDGKRFRIDKTGKKVKGSEF